MVERISNVNWQRIQWCCGERRITTEELAAAVGVSHSVLGRVEQGEDALTFNQLQRLASYLGRGVLFFLEPGPVDPEQVFTSGFRALANQKVDIDASVKRIIELAEWQREAYLSLRADIEDDGVEEFNPPEVDGLSIEDAASVVRGWLDLDGIHSFDGYRRAIERKGMLVFRTNGYQGKWQIPKSSSVLGFAIYHDSFPVIVIRKTKYESRQTFTLFHELAHIILHRDSVIDEEADLELISGRERDANRFAALVLIPDGYLKNTGLVSVPVDVSGIDDWLKHHRARLGVSSEVILLRLLDAGYIDRSIYAAYKEWQLKQPIPEDDGGARLYRYREPKHILGDGYVRMVLSALERQRITLTKASKFLDGLKVGDLHKLEGHYAGH
jgi:Zn-dependent peptidase ImmA (M78 family)/transcriptional regulator with XRE-family HTH domain